MNSSEQQRIAEICLSSTSTDPLHIVLDIIDLPGVPMHGPVHHLADGAALLAAVRNAGADIDLETCLGELFERGSAMPGAICGRWGVCGSATSVGAALSVWHGTGPRSSDRFYSDNMELTSRILAAESELGGPRCCKRNAFTALLTAADFVRERYGIAVRASRPSCRHFVKNADCIRQGCPYYPG